MDEDKHVYENFHDLRILVNKSADEIAGFLDEIKFACRQLNIYTTLTDDLWYLQHLSIKMYIDNLPNLH